jgi:sugar phosphate isomerase/epimerase
MKAAPYYFEQLLDRAVKFEHIGIKPAIELHLFGSKDVFGKNRSIVEENCKKIHGCDYIVHFPIFDLETGYIYDAASFDMRLFKQVLDFCNAIGSHYLIMHRCFGFEGALEKGDAEENFFKILAEWNRDAMEHNILLLIENYGFVWLPDALKKDFLVSPIDHFFPWDMERFLEIKNILSLENVDILLDIAHASISCNMFNMLKHKNFLKHDRRFANITEEDIKKKDVLFVSDFIMDSTHFFHISDTFVWKPSNGLDEMKKYLYTENLPIGSGNIDFPILFDKMPDNKWMIMEIDPADGNYADNIAQLDGITYFRKLVKEGKPCVSL